MLNTRTERTDLAGGMPDHVAATRLCDCADPWLRARAEEVIGDARAADEKAVRIFDHVRDHVRFGLAFSRSRASQTLRRGYGDCGNKTNAQVALLRAVGVPARFRWVQAKTEVLHHLIADFVFRNMPPVASHFFCECCLDGRWVSCDALLDRPLYEGMLRDGLVDKEQIPTIDWDGSADLVLLAPWITEDRGHLPAYDDAVGMLRTGDEGMPPVWIERIIAPVFYPWNLRPSDRLRRQVRA